MIQRTLGPIAIALTLLAVPATADDEERRVVQKIKIHCEGENCEEKAHGEHSFSWVTDTGPGRFVFGHHLGGGFLGVQLAELTPELRTHFGVADSTGVMISKIVEDSPAAKAGLEVGDIITAVDGESIASGRELANKIRTQEEGQTVLLEVWRDGSVQNLTAAIEEREAAPMAGHHMMMTCEDGEDCSGYKMIFAGGHAGHGDHQFACGGESPCEVRVQCEDDGQCECTVNGEVADCEALHVGDHD